jgi:hypothetical protein
MSLVEMQARHPRTKGVSTEEAGERSLTSLTSHLDSSMLVFNFYRRVFCASASSQAGPGGAQMMSPRNKSGELVRWLVSSTPAMRP